MATDLLSPTSILNQLADALPTHEENDSTSDISSSLEALALFTHGCMTLVGFRLQGFDEDRNIETECARLAPRLPGQWNASFNSLSFVYAHEQSSMRFVIKVDRLSGKVEIRGLAVGDERIARFEVAARDYVSASALPLRITMQSDGNEDRSDLSQKLKDVFISETRILDLSKLLKINIIQRLLPSFRKEGYQEESRGTRETHEDPDDREAREAADRQGRSGPHPHPQMPDPLPPRPQPHPYPTVDPLAPRPPQFQPGPFPDFPPPGFDDEYDINRPPRGWGQAPSSLHDPTSIQPYNIGHDDLNPPGLGPHDPLRPSFVGGRGGERGGSRGMHPTFDDPLFQGPRGGRGRGGDEFDPQAPPGARWDPVGPGGAPRFGGGRGGFGSSGGFGGGDII